MWQGEEFFEEAELVKEFKGGGMDGVAAEVAEEVIVFFEDGDCDPWRARRKPSMMPAGPPPMMQQVVADELAEDGISGDERSKQVVVRQRPRWRLSIREIGRARFNASLLLWRTTMRVRRVGFSCCFCLCC